MTDPRAPWGQASSGNFNTDISQVKLSLTTTTHNCFSRKYFDSKNISETNIKIVPYFAKLWVTIPNMEPIDLDYGNRHDFKHILHWLMIILTSWSGGLRDIYSWIRQTKSTDTSQIWIPEREKERERGLLI